MAPWKSPPFPYDVKVDIAYDVKVENNKSGVVFEGFSVTAVGTQPIQIVQATQIKIYPPGFLIENLSGHSCL